MFERTKTWGKGRGGGGAWHQSLSGKKTIILSYLNDCVSKGTVIPAGAVKGGANTFQFLAAAPAAPGLTPAFQVPLNRLYLGTIKL